MTIDERVILDDLGKCFDGFNLLPVLHPMDQADFCHAIHACQNIVLARAAMRQLKAERMPS